MNAFETMARKIGEFIMRNFFLPWMRDHGVVMSYRAEVKSIDHDAKTMTIQRPFDNAITIPYSTSANGLTEGSQCIVFCLGDPLNATVVSDGKLNL